MKAFDNLLLHFKLTKCPLFRRTSTSLNGIDLVINKYEKKTICVHFWP